MLLTPLWSLFNCSEFVRSFDTRIIERNPFYFFRENNKSDGPQSVKVLNFKEFLQIAAHLSNYGFLV